MARESGENVSELQCLLERARLDPAVIEELMARLQPLITRCAGRILHCREDVEDVVQEALLKIFRKLDQFDPDKGSVETWVLQITRNTALSLGRKLTIRKAESLPDEAVLPADKNPGPDRVAEEHDLPGGGLPALLDRLSSDDRLILTLIYLEGKTYNEVATLLGITWAALNSRLTRARERLRKLAGNPAPDS